MLRREIPADSLESFRRAGAGVYGAYLQAEQQRQELAARHVHPWQAPAGTATQLLCTWNALVLQTLGEALLDADYRADPSTVGYLPAVTAEQAWAFFAQVEPWLARARQAAVSPGYRIADDVELPAVLPPWVRVEPCPRPHLDAMLSAARARGTGRGGPGRRGLRR